MIVTLGLRVAQLLFSAVVLALAVVLIKGHGSGHSPSLIEFASFCGAFGLLITAIGIAAVFFEAIHGFITAVLDTLVALFTLAAGIAFATQLKVGNCESLNYLNHEDISKLLRTNKCYGKNCDDVNKGIADIKSRCHEAQALTAFLFFVFACSLAVAVLALLHKSRRTRGSFV